MAKLCFIIGYGGQSLPLLSRILAEESLEHGFEYLVTTSTQALEAVDFLKSSDAIFVYSGSLPSEAEKAIVESSASIVISGSESYIHLSRGPNELAVKATAFYKIGGENNLRQLIHIILKGLGFEVEVASLEEVPWHGIWHPELGTFAKLNDYFSVYPNKDRHCVGLLFYRSRWLYGNTDHVRCLIKALEDEGLGVIPVFTYSFGDANIGAPSAEDSIREFFILNERPVIHALINLTSFFLLDHRALPKKGRFTTVRGLDLLKKMNVPIVQAVHSFSRSVEEWKNNSDGLDYTSQIYQVIMPEVDGLIEPIYLAGSKTTAQGVKKYQIFEEHAKYIAKRVKRWIELRNKPPEKRKVAIILINPPCKSLEANVAVGFGLDVPESVARLLHELKRLGYHVGDFLPRNGKQLIKIIMERKAISEFRWTSIDEIVKSGGAAGFVDADTYTEWFNELPSDVKEKMIRDWGNPRDVLSGRVGKELVGMVYNNKFVVPGVFFGNVFVAPQPKCGCAGASCDGQVCRILHDPTVTPPHQWLAVYRWITRIFKADLIVHFGTHGYLEFRPGKGVGLSPSCWPEISIDTVPHLYVYIVSNPMEGVIAKRRSYASIIDHLYPPMSMADVLDDIDSLLAEYSKAKQLGDSARAEVIYENLLKKAKENSIPVEDGERERIVEGIHRYLSAVRNTQIEMGLHVFGCPPHDPSELAEYVATIMNYDTYSFPSIRRCIAEYVGLNYDEMKKRPHDVNSFGLTNHETLHVLHNVAVNVLKRLLELNVERSMLTAKVVSSLLNEELVKLLRRRV